MAWSYAAMLVYVAAALSALPRGVRPAALLVHSRIGLALGGVAIVACAVVGALGGMVAENVLDNDESAPLRECCCQSTWSTAASALRWAASPLLPCSVVGALGGTIAQNRSYLELSRLLGSLGGAEDHVCGAVRQLKTQTSWRCAACHRPAEAALWKRLYIPCWSKTLQMLLPGHMHQRQRGQHQSPFHHRSCHPMMCMSRAGLCSLLGMWATLIIMEVIPFLALAVGADNMFILAHALHRQPAQGAAG